MDLTITIEDILKIMSENNFELYEEYRKKPMTFLFKKNINDTVQELHIIEDDFYNFELILSHKDKNGEITCRENFIDKNLKPIQPNFKNKYAYINSGITAIKRYEYYNNPYRLCLVLDRLKRDIEKYCIKTFSKMLLPNIEVPDFIRNKFIEMSDWPCSNVSMGIFNIKEGKSICDGPTLYDIYCEALYKDYNICFLVDLFYNINSGDIDEIDKYKDYIIDASMYLKGLLERILRGQSIERRNGLIYFKSIKCEEVFALDPLQMVFNVWYKPFSKSFYDQLIEMQLIKPLNLNSAIGYKGDGIHNSLLGGL